MSNLSKLQETRSWINDWRRHYGKNTERFRQLMNETADEQAANLRGMGGRSPHWCDKAEYERCIEEIRRAGEVG